jgi:hypothetical protein
LLNIAGESAHLANLLECASQVPFDVVERLVVERKQRQDAYETESERKLERRV